MRLAVISSIDKPTIPESKGGVEVWTAEFVAEEAKRGHTIDLYAIAGSITPPNGSLIETLSQPLPVYYADVYFTSSPQELIRRKEQFMATIFTQTLLKVKEHETNYDVIIDSCSFPSFSLNTKFFKKPTVVIGHFPVNFGLAYYAKHLGLGSKTTFVFPSRYQYAEGSCIPEHQRHTIAHGINSSAFSFHPIGSDEMVWMSRIHERIDKGASQAVAVANQTKRHLRLIAYIEPLSETFFQETVKPLFTEHITFQRTDVDTFVDKNQILGNAKLFLFPLQWEEAFGLVLVEAMATGTPVVAFARGAIPEIVKDGVTGFIVNASDSDKRGEWVIKKTGLEGICEAIERVYALPPPEYEAMRQACRRHVEEQFTVEKMVDAYEALYKSILA